MGAWETGGFITIKQRRVTVFLLVPRVSFTFHEGARVPSFLLLPPHPPLPLSLHENLFLFVKFDFLLLCDPSQDITEIAPENIKFRKDHSLY